MKYIVYGLAIALILWAIWFLVKTVRRQLRGNCGCGKDCKNCKK